MRQGTKETIIGQIDGLPAAIVKAFAEAMGITVEASNREEGGACFGLIFPSALVVRATALENP